MQCGIKPTILFSYTNRYNLCSWAILILLHYNFPFLLPQSQQTTLTYKKVGRQKDIVNIVLAFIVLL